MQRGVAREETLRSTRTDGGSAKPGRRGKEREERREEGDEGTVCCHSLLWLRVPPEL